MFDKKQIDAYNSIKAPDELYEKVISNGASTKKSKIYLLPLVASFAACLVIFVGAFMAFNSSGLKVSVFGQELTSTVSYTPESEAGVALARAVPTLSVPVELDVNKATDISVSSGFIFLGASSPATSVTVEEKTELTWLVELTDDFTSCEMTLKDSKGTTTLTLTQDETDGSFTVRIN